MIRKRLAAAAFAVLAATGVAVVVDAAPASALSCPNSSVQEIGPRHLNMTVAQGGGIWYYGNTQTMMQTGCNVDANMIYVGAPSQAVIAPMLIDANGNAYAPGAGHIVNRNDSTKIRLLSNVAAGTRFALGTFYGTMGGRVWHPECPQGPGGICTGIIYW